MKRLISGFAAVVILFVGLERALAGTLVLNPVSEKSATTTTAGIPLFLNPDSAFVPVGVGKVADTHSAIQFDLSSLQGHVISTATLTLSVPGYGTGGGDGTSSFDTTVSGYTGNGTVTLADFSTAPIFTAGSFAESVTVVGNVATTVSLTPISLDVSTFIQTEVGGNVHYGGILLYPINQVAGISTQFQANFANAELTVTTDSTAVPEPSSFALLCLGAGGLAIVTYFRRHSAAV